MFANVIEHSLESKLSYKYIIQLLYPENYTKLIEEFIDYVKDTKYPLITSLKLNYLDLSENTLFYIKLNATFNGHFEEFFMQLYKHGLYRAQFKSFKTLK